MSLLMTAWSRRLGREEEEEEEGDAQKRVGLCVADVGAQISVSSVSVSLAFCLAYLSPFPSVANFGLYAGGYQTATPNVKGNSKSCGFHSPDGCAFLYGLLTLPSLKALSLW